MKLLDNYERSTGVAEQVTTDEVTETNLFLDAVLETAVMKVNLAYCMFFFLSFFFLSSNKIHKLTAHKNLATVGLQFVLANGE